MKNCSIIIVAAFACSFATAGMSEEIIYSFPRGYVPQAQLLDDTDGDLVGAAYSGPQPSGSVYRLVEKHGTWVSHTLHKFNGRSDGTSPNAGLIQDDTGNYYGVTSGGGAYGRGTVYSIASSGGRWIETVLHSFSAGADGSNPIGKLLFDKASGNFYGTTSGSGSYGCGTAFQIARSGGNWTLTTIHSFQGSEDGCVPESRMLFGPKSGTLIGTTVRGGSCDCGTVFMLKEREGAWSESVLYAFHNQADGATPNDIERDTAGNVYGTALGGGPAEMA